MVVVVHAVTVSMGFISLLRLCEISARVAHSFVMVPRVECYTLS